MLSALAETKRNGGSVISINPLLETGLNRFKHPQELIGLMVRECNWDDHFPVRIGGDHTIAGYCKSNDQRGTARLGIY